MAIPIIGEIRIFAGNFAPAGWMFCEGQLLQISDNDALFTLIGTTYGGDGETTFALPDLRGRLPLHQGNGFIRGGTGGSEQVTLTVPQTPAHTHPFLATNNQASSFAPANQTLAATQLASTTAYGTDNPLVALAAQAVTTVGGSQPHDNFQPYLCVNFILSLYGTFPTQS